MWKLVVSGLENARYRAILSYRRIRRYFVLPLKAAEKQVTLVVRGSHSVIVPYIGGVTMEKNWRRKGANILLLGFLMAVSLLAVSCNSHDTQVTNSETQQETDETENASEFLEY